MKILSDFSKDIQTEKTVPGSYEWWYFDAQSWNGYKVVIIFYEGNPFSKRYITALKEGKSARADQFPALSISLYDKEKPIFYSFQEVLPGFAGFSDEKPFGRIGKNQFEGNKIEDRIKFEIGLDQKLVNGDSIEGNLVFNMEKHPFFLKDSNQPTSYSHEWNLVMPKCQVEGQLRIDGYERKEIRFSGLGYHDHNIGFEPLKNRFKEWYWGRYHLQNSTFIYYLIRQNKIWEKKAWLIANDGEFVQSNEIEISNIGYSLFGLKSARVIKCRFSDQKLFLQLDKILDSGPFYQRFLGRLILKSGNNIEEVRGISEYISPTRIHSRLFWPFVNMRIAYPGKVHWVQKSPKLYRWTW